MAGSPTLSEVGDGVQDGGAAGFAAEREHPPGCVQHSARWDGVKRLGGLNVGSQQRKWRSGPVTAWPF